MALRQSQRRTHIASGGNVARSHDDAASAGASALVKTSNSEFDSREYEVRFQTHEVR
jgi:hypothetical protein